MSEEGGKVKLPLFVEVYGETYVGKTHFASAWPGPFIIDLSPRGPDSFVTFYKALAERGFTEGEIMGRYRWCFNDGTSLQPVRDAITEALRMDGVKTIIIDNATWLEDLAVEEWRLEQLRKKGMMPERVAPLYAWHDIRRRVEEIFCAVTRNGRNLIFISPAREEYVVDRPELGTGYYTGKLLSETEGRRFFAKVRYMADVRIFIRIEGRRRVAELKKIRTIDPVSPSYVTEVENVTPEKIVEILGIPKEYLVI